MITRQSITTKSCATIKLGIDPHAKWYYVARQLDGATPQPVQKMDLDGLLHFVAKQQRLAREVGDWSRFNNRREVSSYTGLCPREHSSGGKRRGGSVNKSGNPRVRAMLVEMVWRMIRWQPGYHALCKWMPVPGDAKRSAAARKKAIVAVARQLAVDLWRLFTGQTTAENLGLIYLPHAA